MAVFRVIDEDSPHGLCRDREKMAAILPLDLSLIGQFQKCFVHECRCLKGVIGPLIAQVSSGPATQIVIDQRQLADDADDADLGPYDPGAPPAKQFRTVSCVKVSKDGMVYVCDRGNDRIQVFQKDGKFVKEAFVSKATARL